MSERPPKTRFSVDNRVTFYGVARGEFGLSLDEGVSHRVGVLLILFLTFGSHYFSVLISGCSFSGVSHSVHEPGGLQGSGSRSVDADLPWSEPNAEENRIETLEHLYTHDWGDDGEAVRGITDWIADGPAGGDNDTEGERREAALSALVELMESEDFQDSLFKK